MNVEEARAQKAALERWMLAKLQEFEEDTGCIVNYVEVPRVETTTALSPRAETRLRAVRLQVEIE